MTGQSNLARTSGSGTVRMLLLILLTTTSLALLGIVVATVIRFATPPGSLLEIGLVEDFPPSKVPYEIAGESRILFLVNTGEELIVFYPLNPRGGNCPIRWISEGGYFTDGCWGTKFNLDGSYRTGPPATLDHYLLVVEEGQVSVDRTRRLPGPELDLQEGVYTEPLPADPGR